MRGGGSKDWYGQAFDGDILDTRPYTGIVAYEPTELVITARCGTPLAEVEAALADNRQFLAFEPPHFGPGATLGGVIASGLCGPRRATAGAVRDFVLGAVLMDGQGDVLHFGGQVMKNVAGYDVSRLLAGSLGTLGLMLEHSIKVLPRPMAETTLRLSMSEIDALRALNEWAGQPLPISASCWHAGELTVRLSGAEPALRAARRVLGGEEVPDAAAFWQSLREQQHHFFATAANGHPRASGGPWSDAQPTESVRGDDGEALWRLALPSTASALVVGGEQLIEWGGAQRWLKAPGDAASAARIRASVAAAGGHATLFRGGDKSIGVFHPLAPALARINQRMRDAFDPAGIFNPGRMY
ncbi:MAG TPA: glycolate oxidase subunit GlcE [Telluria sp.]|nr:glycolate oxidase subunit GlcE [Telluria sp.]